MIPRNISLATLLLIVLVLPLGLSLAQASIPIASSPVAQLEDEQVRNRAQLMLDLCERLCLRINNSLHLYNISLPKGLEVKLNQSLQKLNQLKLMFQEEAYQLVSTEAVKLINDLRPIMHYIMSNISLNLEAQTQLEVNASAQVNLKFLMSLKDIINASLSLNITLPKPINTSEIREKIHEIMEALKSNATQIREVVHQIRDYIKSVIKELRNATRTIILPIKIELAVTKHLNSQLMRIQEMASLIVNESKERASQAIGNAILSIQLTIERLEAMKNFVQKVCKAKTQMIENAIEALNATLNRLIYIKNSMPLIQNLKSEIADLLEQMSNKTNNVIEGLMPHHGKIGEKIKEQAQNVIEQVQNMIQNIRGHGHHGRH